MKIGVIGVNHKSADLALREKFATACQKWFGESSLLQGILPHVLLLTCNRIEIYFSSEDLAETHIFLLGILRNEIAGDFEHTLYCYFGKDCFFHLAKVTSGLDSALLGETEIQGQVKIAYESAMGQLSKELHFLFQKSLKMGKDIRSTGLSYTPSLPKGVLALSKDYFEDQNIRVLLIGFSKINLILYHAFRKELWVEPIFCNRTLKKVPNSATFCLSWEERNRWDEYDLIICSTKSPTYILDLQEMRNKNIFRKKLILDLGVPRNVSPSFSHPLISIFNIDQLHKTIEQKDNASLPALLETVTRLAGRQCLLYEKRELKLQEL